MDTAITNGDWAVNANGIPVVVSGLQEQLQRAFIRLKVKEGSFAYDSSLGSRLYTLKPNDGDLNTKAHSLVQEAIKDMPQTTVQSVVCVALPGGGFAVAVSLQTVEGKGSITVKFNGN